MLNHQKRTVDALPGYKVLVAEEDQGLALGGWMPLFTQVACLSPDGNLSSVSNTTNLPRQLSVPRNWLLQDESAVAQPGNRVWEDCCYG